MGGVGVLFIEGIRSFHILRERQTEYDGAVCLELNFKIMYSFQGLDTGFCSSVLFKQLANVLVAKLDLLQFQWEQLQLE